MLHGGHCGGSVERTVRYSLVAPMGMGDTEAGVGRAVFGVCSPVEMVQNKRRRRGQGPLER